MHYASLCAIAKDEDPDIREWVEYHLRIGFEHIYLYDNGSVNPLSSLLADYAAHQLVTITDFPGRRDAASGPQLAAYAAALASYGRQNMWMGFIDIDEFIVPKEHEDIKDLLDSYMDFGGLAVHWKMFGSCGHKKRPPGGVLVNYNRVIRNDKQIKSIVRTDRVAAVRSPHHFLYKDGSFCVNEDKVPVLTHHSYHVSRTIQINHYYYKSFEDFLLKMERGLATPAVDGRATRDEKELQAFTRQLNQPGVIDVAALNKARVHAEDVQDIKALASRILYDCRAPFGDFAARIADALRKNDKPTAARTLRSCLRYHDGPAVWDIAAKLYLLADKAEQALPYINRQILDYYSPHRPDGFKNLVEYYRQTDNDAAAKAIEEELYS